MDLEKVFQSLLRWDASKDVPEIQEADHDQIKESIRRCFEWGFSEMDAFRWVRCTEECNTIISEETALRRMRVIGSKYPAYTSRSKK